LEHVASGLGDPQDGTGFLGEREHLQPAASMSEDCRSHAM
jgi:hypothetical protein